MTVLLFIQTELQNLLLVHSFVPYKSLRVSFPLTAFLPKGTLYKSFRALLFPGEIIQMRQV